MDGKHLVALIYLHQVKNLTIAGQTANTVQHIIQTKSSSALQQAAHFVLHATQHDCADVVGKDSSLFELVSYRKLSPVSARNQSYQQPGDPRPLSIMLPEHLLRSAYTEKTLEAFIHMYTPCGDLQATNIEGREFVDMLPLLTICDRALQMAVLAIGTALLGQTTGDQDLSQRGRYLYSKALSATAIALRSPARTKSEALFAVPRVMALFEILFGVEADSTTQAKSWLSHAKGETALFFDRNPEDYSKTDTAHALFVNARFRPLITAIRARKATVLNNEEWKTLPWRNRIKTPNDSLLDIFCEIPELLEAVDKIDSSALSERRMEELRIQIVAKCWTLHFQLQDWLVANPTSIYTPPTADSTTLVDFPDIEIACLTVRYWVLALFLYSCLDTSSGIPLGTDTSTLYANRPHPRMFARFIARSVSYFLQERYGITGAMAISFPLGNALFYIRRNLAAEAQYMDMIMKAWNDPMLPSAIRIFLGNIISLGSTSLLTR